MSVRTDTVLGGRYRLGTLLGRGGMAEVYDAIDERLDRAVAVKVLRPEMAARIDVRRRFEAEARAAARLSHPNIVAVFDTGEDETPGGKVSWIVMERLPGETLADRMGAGPLDPAWVTRVAGDVLGALGVAHDAGIVHRDIKPGNILIAADGCAKVADFGIAKSLEASDDATHTGQLIGTPAYLSPERIDGESATKNSDLYALGVVLYEALAGQKPFRGTTPVSVAYAVHHSQVPPLAEVRPGLPDHLVDAVHRAMDRDPARRFATAGQMADALRSGQSGQFSDATVLTSPVDSTLVLDEATVAAVRAPATTPSAAQASATDAYRPPAAHRRGTRTFVVALVAALLVLLALGMLLARDDRPAGAKLADRLRDVAGALDAGDGFAAPEAARRLETLAGTVEKNDPAAKDQANALLTAAATWRSQNALTAGAADRIRDVVTDVPGADPGAFSAPTTTAPTTTAAPARGHDGKRGKGKKDD